MYKQPKDMTEGDWEVTGYVIHHSDYSVCIATAFPNKNHNRRPGFKEALANSKVIGKVPDMIKMLAKAEALCTDYIETGDDRTICELQDEVEKFLIELGCEDE